MPKPDLTVAERLLVSLLRSTPGQSATELMASSGLRYRSNLVRHLRLLRMIGRVEVTADADGVERYSLAAENTSVGESTNAVRGPYVNSERELERLTKQPQ